MIRCSLVLSSFRKPRGLKKIHIRSVFDFVAAFYYLLLVLVDRIVDIKPVEIFWDLFGVHWMSFPHTKSGDPGRTAC